MPHILGSFVSGAIAGYAIAIPVGAIAVLILEFGMRRGFRVAAAAGAGAASADLIYAFLAMTAGRALASAIRPLEVPLRLVAVAALVAIAVHGLVRTVRFARAGVPGASGLPASARRTYVRFLGITLLNPATVIYFAALILGLRAGGAGPAEAAAFVAGAFLASLSWQTLLAAAGSLLHRRLSPRLRTATSVLGNLVILGFAVGIGRDLLGG